LTIPLTGNKAIAQESKQDLSWERSEQRSDSLSLRLCAPQAAWVELGALLLPNWRAKVQPVIDEWVAATPGSSKAPEAFKSEIVKAKAGG